MAIAFSGNFFSGVGTLNVMGTVLVYLCFSTCCRVSSFYEVKCLMPFNFLKRLDSSESIIQHIRQMKAGLHVSMRMYMNRLKTKRHKCAGYTSYLFARTDTFHLAIITKLTRHQIILAKLERGPPCVTVWDFMSLPDSLWKSLHHYLCRYLFVEDLQVSWVDIFEFGIMNCACWIGFADTVALQSWGQDRYAWDLQCFGTFPQRFSFPKALRLFGR